MTLRRWSFILFLLFNQAWSMRTPTGEKASIQTEQRSEMAELLKKAQASVVSIRTFALKDKRGRCRVGSGFVYDKHGFVVTRRSVIHGADSIIVTLADGRFSTAWVVHNDGNTEIALLKLTLGDLSSMAMGESAGLAVQSQLAVLGNSLGVFPSVTLGPYLGRNKDGMLRLGVVVPPGNCGGPVLDERGHIIGVLAGRVLKGKSREMEEERMGLALPIERVQEVVDDVLDHFKKGNGWVGISVVDLEGEKGVKVVRVVPDGPAERAEICKLDTIIGFEGRPVSSARELAKWVGRVAPESRVVFTVRRGKEEVSRSVHVGHMPWTKKRRVAQEH
jgi:S1-C subfamily serine protease